MVTAKKFLIEQYELDGSESHYNELLNEDVYESMIEFAKIKVTEALEAASEKCLLESVNHNLEDEIEILKENEVWIDYFNTTYRLNKDSILNAYPLDLIK